MPLPPMLYSGIAGIGWVIAHRRSRGWDDDRGLASVTTRLARSVREDRSPATHFDLLTGVTGYGVLALEARGIAGDDELADAVLGWLVSRMDEGTSGRWWTTPALMPHHERAGAQPP